MDLLLPALISGVTAGLLYGLLGFAVVLLHKSTGVSNFAQAAIGTIGAFVVWRLLNAGLPTGLAVTLGLVACGVLGGLIYIVVMLPRRQASPTNLIVRTLALGFVIAATLDRLASVGQPFSFPSILPEGGVRISGTTLPWSTLFTLGISSVVIAGFAIWFRTTRFGLMSRAVAADPEISRLLGVPSRRIAMVMWAVTALLAGATGILSAHALLVSTHMLDDYLLYAFAGAIVFGFNSLPGSVIGGLLTGVLSSVLSTYYSPETALITIFGVVVFVLLVRPQGIFGDREVVRV